MDKEEDKHDFRRYVHVGNLDVYASVESIKPALVALLLGLMKEPATQLVPSHLVGVEVPGWGENLIRHRKDRSQGGEVKPRKRRDEGKKNRGFAVLEFDSVLAGRDACEALSRNGGGHLDGRSLRSSIGVTVRAYSSNTYTTSTHARGGVHVDGGEAEKNEEKQQDRRAHNQRRRKRLGPMALRRSPHPHPSKSYSQYVLNLVPSLSRDYG